MIVTTAPQVGPLRAFEPPSIDRTRLNNGLDLLVVSKHGLPVVDVQLVLRGGAAIDAPQQAGRASLTAELIDEGTERYSALDISNQIELLGADLELRAGWDACFASVHGLSRRLPELLDLLGEVILRPRFPEDEFRRKHEERLHALAQERDEPRLVAVKTLNRAVFGDQHPFGRPLSGTVPSVTTLNRESLIEYYRHTFSPAHSHLVIVGDVSVEHAQRLADAAFGEWKAAAPPAKTLPLPRQDARAITLVDRPGAAQSEVRVGHVAPHRTTDDYYALQVLNTILGGSFKSRLNMILRERRGFTYGASSSLALRRAGGLFSAGAAVFTDNTSETITIMVEQVSRIREEPVGIEEIGRARQYLALGFMRHFETTNDIVGHVAEIALYGLPLSYLHEYPERIARVGIDDVAAVARKHLHPDQLAMVVVGDRARVGAPLQALGLAPIEVREAE
jgi:zinc protease